jgi:hypothetical protein
VNPATVRDRLYVRAVVVDNGATRAALISADQIAVGEETWATAVREIASELDAPVENIIIAATHTHSNGGLSSFMSGDATCTRSRRGSSGNLPFRPPPGGPLSRPRVAQEYDGVKKPRVQRVAGSNHAVPTLLSEVPDGVYAVGVFRYPPLFLCKTFPGALPAPSSS